MVSSGTEGDRLWIMITATNSQQLLEVLRSFLQCSY